MISPTRGDCLASARAGVGGAAAVLVGSGRLVQQQRTHGGGRNGGCAGTSCLLRTGALIFYDSLSEGVVFAGAGCGRVSVGGNLM